MRPILDRAERRGRPVMAAHQRPHHPATGEKSRHLINRIRHVRASSFGAATGRVGGILLLGCRLFEPHRAEFTCMPWGLENDAAKAFLRDTEEIILHICGRGSETRTPMRDTTANLLSAPRQGTNAPVDMLARGSVVLIPWA